MARAALGWTVRELAAATGLHRNTITNIEVGRYAGDQGTLTVIKRVLEEQGIVFIEANGGGPGVRFNDPAQQRAKPRP
ncbi:helix-turn-helix domain-containing protein [Bradyrhizobium sp. USDA 3650]